MNKTVKWILIALAIVAGIVLVIVAIKYFTKPAGTVVPPPAPSAGPSNSIVDILGGLFSGDFFSNLFGGGKKCDPNNPGFQKDGVYNPDKCGTAPGLGCDPNRPGWNLGNFPDPSCP